MNLLSFLAWSEEMPARMPSRWRAGASRRLLDLTDVEGLERYLAADELLLEDLVEGAEAIRRR